MFKGSMYNHCRTTQEPFNSTFWEKADASHKCDIYEFSGKKCPSGQYCGNPAQYGLSLENENVYYNENMEFGMGTFDNFF